MKKLVLIFTLLFTISYVNAQTYDANALDGRVIFKLKDSYAIDGMNVPKPADRNIISKREILSDYPMLEQVLAPYNVINFERPSYYTQKQRLIRIFVVDFANPADVDNVINDLKSLNVVEYAEKSIICKTTFTPNDTYFDGWNNWYLTQVGAEQAWDITQGNSSVKIAIVDGAVFGGHEDLTLFAQRDVADNDGDATPPLDVNTDFGWSHGTHCAGLATATINNAKGISSLGGNAELIGVKCTRDVSNSTTVEYSYQGIQWACENGADVVSMSFGSASSSQSTQDLINGYSNIVFLAAAGNDNVTSTFYPAGYDNVICVGSVNFDDSRSSFSNYNPAGGPDWVDICSPGGYSHGGLMSTVYTASGNAYDQMGGTSMATPFAAGLAGAMKSIYPTMTPTQIKNCLISSGVAVNQGMGPRIDAQAALQCAQALMNGNVEANFTSPNSNVVIGNTVDFVDFSSDGGTPITSWQWTFTGGTPATFSGQNPPPITYSALGSYTVELTVTNANGSDTKTMVDYVVVGMQAYGEWIEQASAFSVVNTGVNSISIVDKDIVWITAYDGTGGNAAIQEFSKTIDGGDTWVQGSIDINSSGSGISMIQALDVNTAFMIAYPNGAGDDQGVYKTTDGGVTWNRQNTALFNNGSSFSNVIHFWDENTGFCQGDPIGGEYELYTTTDGGTNWVPVPGTDIPNPISGEYGYVRGIEVVGDHVWFTTNKGRLYHSTDKGYTWTVAQTPLTDFSGANGGEVSFKDAMNGMIMANNGDVYKTTDGGNTWDPIIPVGQYFTGDICWIEGTDYIFSTGQSGSSYSIDGGDSWNFIDNEQHTTVEFISPNVGWSGFFTESPTSKGIWKWGNINTLTPDFIADNLVSCEDEIISFTDYSAGINVSAWQWSFPGGTPSTSTDQNPTVTYSNFGDYDVTLIVTDDNGTDTIVKPNYISISSCASVEENQETPFTVYPNPTNNYFVVTFDKTFNTANYQVYDIAGKVVTNGVINNTTSTQISVENLSKGIYTLKVLVDGNVYNQKIVVD